MGDTLEGLRAQASLEYLMAFVVALGIAVAAGYALLGLGSGAANLVPTSCSFDLGISCQDIAIVSNSSSSLLAFLGSNSREYAINGISMSLLVSGQRVAPQCTTGRISPGETFVCFARMSALQKPGSAASGNLTASVGYCSMNGGDCNGGAIQETYVGRYTTSVSNGAERVGLVFSKPFREPNGNVAINVSFDLLGYGLFLASVSISPHSGTKPAISYSGPGSTSLSVTASTLADYCAALVNVTYANQTGTDAVALNASNYTGNSYKISGNTNANCYTLSSSTKTVSVSGQGNTAGLFTLANVFINISSTGGHNDLAVFNSTATLKIAGNNNNVTMFGSNVVLTITGTYNMVTFINSRISNLTASGNDNLIVLRNTTVAHESITGANDIVQGS